MNIPSRVALIPPGSIASKASVLRHTCGYLKSLAARLIRLEPATKFLSPTVFIGSGVKRTLSETSLPLRSVLANSTPEFEKLLEIHTKGTRPVKIPVPPRTT